MARKPLIQPGSVLPPAEAADEGVLGRIIARDRERSGRAESREQEENRNVTTLQRWPEETKEGTTVPPNEGTNVAPGDSSAPSANAPDAPSLPARTRETARAVPDGDSETGTTRPTETEERMQTALARAGEDDVAVVTVRAPSSLNSYIDRYVERINRVHPKRKYRKQDAVAEMFAWFYAEHPMPPAPAEDDI